tara:strand:+ start:1869 stop:2045 length:177 start_codon:yes stop_codon:yes gene_type:complete
MNQEKENQIQIEYVKPKIDKVMCDGGDGDLGHPAVYFKIDKKQEVVCNYCNKRFIKKD